ncbi:hypothetical protein [Conexibacter sp. CPCC 206217]|uniref:hypothetical protein n=1 Tax=Conexibacter sp. CPCC 206217 TaxID=3064574 RepID=UPI002717E6A0|nr:hypothetical protein [Conexibacter sp. CPCC 206217]MDO8209058.1 hypothetical protein [Conexibacter sp. CPCC 206217]
MKLPTDEWKRAALRRMILPVVLIVVGAVIATITDGTLQAIGFGIFGVGGVLVVSFAFLEIGYSEDRERARDAERRRPPS